MPQPMKPKDTIEVAEMSDAQRKAVVDEVMTSIMFVEEAPPPADVAREIAASLMDRDTRFDTYPVSNGRGGQSDYILALHEAIMEQMKRPVTQEEGVAEAYVPAATLLAELEPSRRNRPDLDQMADMVAEADIDGEEV